MKKAVIMVFLIILCAISESYAASEDRLNPLIPKVNDICKICVQSQSPLISEHELYDYVTMRYNEIKYISHYFNSLELVEKEPVIPSDGQSFYIVIEYIDGSSLSFSMALKNIVMSDKLGYSILAKDYWRILDFIYAIKNEKIILENDITFEPSEWAKASIEKAIENELVPKWNQINYKGDITRLEACQLIVNLIENSVHYKDSERNNPFIDTNDNSIIDLYNLKILDGKSKNMFLPYDVITREELAKVLSSVYCYVDGNITLKDSSISLRDEAMISDWAIKSVVDMTSLGILIGDENGDFEPQRNMTKEEVIVALLRLAYAINE